MSTPVKLPELGESVTEGTVTRWLKQVGDTVEVDEPLLEVSTDKVDTEIPSPVAGKLLEIKAEEDETVEVGAELCVVGEEGEDAGSPDQDEDASSGSDEAGSSDEAEADDEDDEDEAEESDDSEDAEEPDESEDEQPAAQESSEGASGGSGGGGGTPVQLPELGESVTEGTITRWLKSVGDEVEVDEPLVEVSTDKVDTEIPSPVAGTLQEIKAEEDETVEVGAELCVIGDGSAAPADSGDSKASEDSEGSKGESREEPEDTKEEEPAAAPEDEGSEGDDGSGAEPERAEPAAEEQEVQEERAEQKAPAQDEPKQERKEPARSDGSGDGGTYVTPLVRKMAAEHGVDLSSMRGSGVGGRIRKQDVLAAAEEQSKPSEQPAAASKAEASESSAPKPSAPSPLRGKTEKMTRLRKTIAKRMVESLQVSAQLTTVVEVDVTGIARLRQSVKEEFAAREGVNLSFMPFFAKATTDALKEHPALNAAIDTEKGEITYFDRENLAIAVDTEKGLLTPVIKEAGDLSVSGLAKKIADIADRTRNNKIGPDDLSGGTFTLTNTGSRGALFDTPIINQPQVAILGTGSVVKRPVVIDDANLGETIAVRHMIYLALTYDHRLVDGADAARFLSDVKERLEAAQFEV